MLLSSSGSHLFNEGLHQILNGATTQRNYDIFCQFIVKLIIAIEHYKTKFHTKLTDIRS